jgi:hypothetical protein
VTKFVDVLFSDFIPDRGGAPWPEDPGYLVDAVGIRPTLNGWRTSAQATLAGAATVAAVPISMYHTGDTAAQDFFVATSSNIYQSDDVAATWNDVSRSTAYSAISEVDWAQFDAVMFAALGQQVQRKEITTTTATLFTDLGGGAPAFARSVARVRDHLVLGGLGSGEGATGRTIQWSSIGDPEDYPTPGSATALARQAGSRVLPYELGLVRKVVGGEKFGIVMQENGLSRMTYRGGNVVYNLDTYNRQVGIGESRLRSVVQAGGVLYFVSNGGMYATDGYGVQKLSDGVLNDALIANNLSHPDAALGVGVAGAHDERNGTVLIRTNGGLVLGYNYRLGKFFIQSVATALSVIASGIATNNDNTPLVYGISSARLLQKLTAAPTDVNLQTGYIELVPNMRINVLAAHLLGSGTTTPTISYKATDTPNSVDVAQTGFTAMTAAPRGIKQTSRSNGRFFAFRVTGAQGLGALLRGLRVFYEVVSEE